jgi:hypothetical protein
MDFLFSSGNLICISSLFYIYSQVTCIFTLRAHLLKTNCPKFVTEYDDNEQCYGSTVGHVAVYGEMRNAKKSTSLQNFLFILGFVHRLNYKITMIRKLNSAPTRSRSVASLTRGSNP